MRRAAAVALHGGCVVSQSAHYKGPANIQIGELTGLLLWILQRCMMHDSSHFAEDGRDGKCAEENVIFLFITNQVNIYMKLHTVPNSYRHNTIKSHCDKTSKCR
jgi:hypothetical protein